MDVPHKDIDMSLILPHYRARHQPVDHRMSMFVGSDTGAIKLKVCRTFPRSKFYLEVQAETSDVTVWLPSDFSGQIHHSGRVSYSAGFVNRIMQRARINEPRHEEIPTEDDVVVYTRGHITFRIGLNRDSSPRPPFSSSHSLHLYLTSCFNQPHIVLHVMSMLWHRFPYTLIM
ncbi:hypothetical protein BD779DRAFT_1502601 [Infundibulicybe gibba]|nr:hypothetical protein BD779DRAFT_1502601 [Infundibulicybe gibba]